MYVPLQIVFCVRRQTMMHIMLYSSPATKACARSFGCLVFGGVWSNIFHNNFIMERSLGLIEGMIGQFVRLMPEN